MCNLVHTLTVLGLKSIFDIETTSHMHTIPHTVTHTCTHTRAHTERVADGYAHICDARTSVGGTYGAACMPYEMVCDSRHGIFHNQFFLLSVFSSFICALSSVRFQLRQKRNVVLCHFLSISLGQKIFILTLNVCTAKVMGYTSQIFFYRPLFFSPTPSSSYSPHSRHRRTIDDNFSIL